MPRRSVEFHVGEYYHVYNRGHDRQRIFHERENYLFFLRKAREYLVDTGDEKNPSGCCQIVSYCLMPNHFHLLVKLTSDGFSAAMQSLGQSYANALRKQTGQIGSLFEGRFKAIPVEHEEYLLHLTRYIHLNPMVALLVEQTSEWEFSSYPEFIGTRNGTLAHPEVVLRAFDSLADYQKFVDAGLTAPHRSISHLLLD